MKVTNIKSNFIPTLFLFTLLIGLFSCEEERDSDVLFTGDDYQNIMQYINEYPEYSLFKSIVEAGSMVDVLSSYNSNGGTGYTLFLPTNDAVANFVSESDLYASFEELVGDAEYCAEIVRYHLINGTIPSNDFPNGALADKTISNFYLTIFFREDNGEITYAVNDESKVVITNIDLSNGVIHTIDKMLTPIVFTSYQWLQKRSEFSIFLELLEKCGLADTLNAYELDELGRQVYNEYTVLAESNDLYAENGINSFADLVKTIDPSADNQNYTDLTNKVNKYARYHILEQSIFLDEFDIAVYNTYGDLPISVDVDDILKINTGTMVFDSVFTETDTTIINYLQVKVVESNIVTSSGAIHQLDHLLKPYLPGRKTVTYQFYEEPIINALKSVEGEHDLDLDELERINVLGTRTLTYTKSPTTITGNSNADYLFLEGDVEFSFETTKILAGRYKLKLVLDRGDPDYASIQASVDGKKVGVVLDLTVDAAQFRTFTIGTVDFSEFSSHTVKLRTIIPGELYIDRIIFEPI